MNNIVKYIKNYNKENGLPTNHKGISETLLKLPVLKSIRRDEISNIGVEYFKVCKLRDLLIGYYVFRSYVDGSYKIKTIHKCTEIINIEYAIDHTFEIPLNNEDFLVYVRKDILADLYKAIDEYANQIDSLPQDEWRFGNVMELRDELAAGKRYSEITKTIEQKEQ